MCFRFLIVNALFFEIILVLEVELCILELTYLSASYSASLNTFIQIGIKLLYTHW